MDAVELTRQAAAQHHFNAVAKGLNSRDPYAFAVAEAKRRNLDVETTVPGAALLDGGRATLIAKDALILHENIGTPFEQAYLVAHEIGHADCGDDDGEEASPPTIEPTRSAEPSPTGLDRVVDYGRRQRREIQMDLFAREFLLPRALVRELHLQHNLTASAIAEQFGAPIAVITPLDPRDPRSEPAAELARRFVTSSRELFLLKDPGSELQVLREEDDGLGGRVVRFQQTYGGLEVWPAQLTANVSEHGYLTTVTGAYVPTPVALDLSSQITPAEALARAARKIGAAGPAEVKVHSTPKLKIYTEKSREPALSYEMVLEANGRHERIFVDAHSGEVLAAITPTT